MHHESNLIKITTVIIIIIMLYGDTICFKRLYWIYSHRLSSNGQIEINANVTMPLETTFYHSFTTHSLTGSFTPYESVMNHAWTYCDFESSDYHILSCFMVIVGLALAKSSQFILNGRITMLLIGTCTVMGQLMNGSSIVLDIQLICLTWCFNLEVCLLVLHSLPWKACWNW